MGRNSRACFEQNAAAFTPVGRWGCESPYTRGEAPLFHLGFDKNKASLSKVDMYAAGSIGAYSGEEVVTVEPNKGILEFTTVSCEKDSATSWPIAHTNNISFLERRSQWRSCERVIVGLVTVGVISDGISRVTRKTEMGIRLRSQADGDVCIHGEIEHFYFPVIDFVQFGKREVGLNRGGGSWVWEKGKLCS